MKGRKSSNGRNSPRSKWEKYDGSNYRPEGKESCRECGYHVMRGDLYRGYCTRCSPDHPYNHKRRRDNPSSNERHENYNRINRSNPRYNEDDRRRRSYSRDYERGDNFHDEDRRCDRQYREYRSRSDSYNNPCSRSSSSPRSSRSRHEVRKPRFPPPFQESEADYIFHPSSGYFFEEISGYYYDPKSKLYYSTDQKKYYSYKQDRQRFQELDDAGGASQMPMADKVAPQVDSGLDVVAQALKGDRKPLPTASQKISICIKQQPTKSSKTKKRTDTQSINPTNTMSTKQSKSVKEREADMEKWNQRVKEQDELPSEDLTETRRKEINHLLETDKVIRTKSGKAVCLICRRKFPTDEKLEQHRELSKLHMHNVSKLKSEITSYVDRAHQRRSMYKSDEEVLPILDASRVIQAPSLEHARDVDASESVIPESILDSNNIGNQMLQKLGWKGGSLGRSGADGDEKGSNQSIMNEWNRIEKLASSKK